MPAEDELREAVEELDGLIGWLTYYGALRKTYTHSRALSILKTDARDIVRAEFQAFLAAQRGEKRRYLYIVELLKRGPQTWETLEAYLSSKEAHPISSSRLQAYLNKLLDHSFIVKRDKHYFLADPLFKLL